MATAGARLAQQLQNWPNSPEYNLTLSEIRKNWSLGTSYIYRNIRMSNGLKEQLEKDGFCIEDAGLSEGRYYVYKITLAK